MTTYEIHYADDWAALYVDGRVDLGSIGDSYVAEERALLALGVKLVYDNAFMRGQSQRSGVAPTLQDVEVYEAERADRQAKAALLREEAAALIAQAAELDP